MKPRIVVIEDDPQMRRFLRAALGSSGYDVYGGETARRGLAEAAARRPDAVLLDLGLPDMDGLDVLRQLRGWSSMPVIILSARGQERVKVQALDNGADDYLVKPFGTGELLARLRVALRHASRTVAGSEIYQAHGVKIDLTARRITARGREVHLTPTEFKLLAELVRNAGRVLTQKHLLREVWGPGHLADSHYLRLYMVQLRNKLEQDPTDPRLLLTEQAVGYRLAEEQSVGAAPEEA